MNENNSHHAMKQFLNVFKKYNETSNEENLTLLIKYLQLFGSTTTDKTIFDPQLSVVCEFFIKLYDLLSYAEKDSTLAWCCVNVLIVASKNSAMRMDLIKVYQFWLPLSRLLGLHLITEKKVKLLKLLQNLTCGLEISWHITELSPLLQILTTWIESQEDEDVVCTSLAVIVNICYKNTPAIDTLSRKVNIKEFLKTLMNIHNEKTEVHSIKLLILLDKLDNLTEEHVTFSLIQSTFKCNLESFKAEDSIQMRQSVEIFHDIWNRSKFKNRFRDYPNYVSEMEKIITALNANVHEDCAMDCVSYMFHFIETLILMKIPSIQEYYLKIITTIFKWISANKIVFSAISVMKAIAVEQENCEGIKKSLLEAILPLVGIVEETNDMYLTENCKILTEVMKFLIILLKIEEFRQKIVQKLQEKTLVKIFQPARNNSCKNELNEEISNLYIHTLKLICQLEEHDDNWNNVFCNIVQHKEVQLIISEALFNANEDIKVTTLDVISHKSFPRRELSTAMVQLHVFTERSFKMPRNTTPYVSNSLLSVYPISTSQNGRLDELMNRVTGVLENNLTGQPDVSDIMELYEHKISELEYTEKISLASVQAANSNCIALQQRQTQLRAELLNLRQMLVNLRRNHEMVTKEKNDTAKNLQDVTNRLGSETGHRKVAVEKLQKTEKILAETQEELLTVQEKYKITYEEKENLIAKNTELLAGVDKLEKTLKKQEELRETYKNQIRRLESQLKKTEVELEDKTINLTKCREELKNSNKILETITQLTASKRENLM